jgi:3-hydroxy-9,10-secoandrosta-1,3,5(10)-triene-9,17-dione monooxygenase
MANDMSDLTQEAGKVEILARLVARARDMAPAIRERAAATEQARKLPAATMRDFSEAGFFRVFQPERYGGYELDYGEPQLVLCNEIGRACGSSAWVLSVVACHSWMLGMFPHEAQDEVWGETPDAILSSAVIPDKAAVEPVKGGLTVSGRWRFSSGVDHVQWAVIGVPLTATAGAPPALAWCLVPRRDFTIEDTWFVAGLCGTGSNDIVIDRVFIPDHRIVPLMATMTGTAPGGAVNHSHIYRLPLFAVFPYNICAPALGIARAAVEFYIENAKHRSTVKFGPPNFGPQAMHLRMVEAGAEIDSAEALLTKNALELNAIGRAGGQPTPEQQARYGRDLSYAAQMFMKAVDGIFYSSGGHGLFDGSPIQRVFRDVHAVNAQIGLRWENLAATYASVVLGLDCGAAH